VSHFILLIYCKKKNTEILTDTITKIIIITVIFSLKSENQNQTSIAHGGFWQGRLVKTLPFFVGGLYRVSKEQGRAEHYLD